MCDDKISQYINGLGVQSYSKYMDVVTDMMGDYRIPKHVREEYMDKLIQALEAQREEPT